MANIITKKQLKFYLMADRMMNRGVFNYSFKQRLKYYLLPDYIMHYLEALRKSSYYSNKKGSALLKTYYRLKLYRLGIKLGFDIGSNVLGYGCVIGHPGTIVIGSSNRIGNYSVLHTSTCISNNGKKIGDGLYLSAGVIITSQIILGDNILIGANSLVNSSFEENNIMIAGCPAVKKKGADAWFLTNGEEYIRRYNEIETLKRSLKFI